MEKKIKHLEMIEAIIERMAKNSFQLKGWAITLVSIIGALSINNDNRWFIILALIPIIGFCILDAFYLKTERKYRYYYEYVASQNESEITFSMNLDSFQWPSEQKKKVTFMRCLLSFSILAFYLAITIALVIVGIIIILPSINCCITGTN